MSLLYEPWIHLKVSFDGCNSFGQVFISGCIPWDPAWSVHHVIEETHSLQGRHPTRDVVGYDQISTSICRRKDVKAS